jgi:hypothetical protein
LETAEELPMKMWHLSLLLLAFLAVGCRGSSVGDPCTPEQIPPGGFNLEESYLETSSVQCRTRVCMVRGLQGDPTNVFYEAGDSRNTCMLGVDADCHSAEEIEDTVYCTCRCRAPEGSNTPTCNCPGGFECVDVLESGGIGIQGGYCVKVVDEEPPPPDDDAG